MEIPKVDRKQIEKLAIVLKNSRIKIFEHLYEDTLVVYNENFIPKAIADMDYRRQKQDLSRRPRKGKTAL